MIAVIGGGGAIGGLLAAELIAGGQDVVLCVRTPLDSLVVERGTEGRRISAPAVWTLADAQPVELAIVALKAMDAASARPWLEALQPELVVAVMNGVEHEARVGVPVLPALSYTAVERVGPGHLVHRAGNELVAPAGDGERFAALFAGTALRVELTADFRTAAWRKLLSNLAGNPLTALTAARAAVFELESIRQLALGLLREGLAVGRAEGAQLADDEPEQMLAFYDNLPPDSGSSMLYDRLAGRPLEYDALTGAVVRTADRHGLDIPLNRAILALLEGLDRQKDGEPLG